MKRSRHIIQTTIMEISRGEVLVGGGGILTLIGLFLRFFVGVPFTMVEIFAPLVIGFVISLLISLFKGEIKGPKDDK